MFCSYRTYGTSTSSTSTLCTHQLHSDIIIGRALDPKRHCILLRISTYGTVLVGFVSYHSTYGYEYSYPYGNPTVRSGIVRIQNLDSRRCMLQNNECTSIADSLVIDERDDTVVLVLVRWTQSTCTRTVPRTVDVCTIRAGPSIKYFVPYLAFGREYQY